MSSVISASIMPGIAVIEILKYIYVSWEKLCRAVRAFNYVSISHCVYAMCAYIEVS